MTALNLIELVKVSFPEVPDNTVIALMNAAQEQFCNDTDILVKEDDIITANSQPTNSYSLPTDCLRVNEVQFLSSTGANISPNYNLSFQGYQPTDESPFRNYNTGNVAFQQITWSTDAGTITFHSSTAVDFTRLPDVIAKIHLQYIQRPLAISSASLSYEPSIPTAFHSALRAKVLEELNIAVNKVSQSQYWEKKYQEFVIKGKRFANQHYSNSAYIIQTPKI